MFSSPPLVFHFTPWCEVSSWRLRKPNIIEENLTTSELGSCILGQSFRSLRALQRSTVQCRGGGRAKRGLELTPTPPPVRRDPQLIMMATSPQRVKDSEPGGDLDSRGDPAECRLQDGRPQGSWHWQRRPAWWLGMNEGISSAKEACRGRQLRSQMVLPD